MTELRQCEPRENRTLLDVRSLFETHYASIWRLLARLGVPQPDLDDAAQEVFWVAARRIGDIRDGCEHSFLYGVALRVASDVRRKLSVASPTLPTHDAPSLASLDLNPEQEFEAHQARELLSAILEQMPEELRSVFVLYELENMEVREIAALQSIPVGTASSRLRRARQAFSTVCTRLQAARKRLEG